MNILHEVISQTAVSNERIAIILGFITLTLALAAFASCRTFVSLLAKFGIKTLARSKTYQKFNKYHMFYWWFFGVAVLAHVLMAILHTGLPKPGDPDAWIHWIILILGFGSALSGVALFLSCRISPRLFARTIPKLSLTNKTYAAFFKYHSYYWWIFTIFVIAHFVVVYLHAGIWPGAG